MLVINFSVGTKAALVSSQSWPVEPTVGKEHPYARRVRSLKGSATQELMMSALSDPSLISLAGGFPGTTFFDENFRKPADGVSHENATALQDCPINDTQGAKRQIARVMDAESIPAGGPLCRSPQAPSRASTSSPGSSSMRVRLTEPRGKLEHYRRKGLVPVAGWAGRDDRAVRVRPSVY